MFGNDARRRALTETAPRLWVRAHAVSIAVVAKEVISTSEAPGGFAGYSQAIRANGVVFVSGQGPFDPATGDVVGETIEEQTRQCLRNVEAILKAAGSTMDDVVQATFILLDESDFAGMNEEWNRWFPTNPPARQGARLPISPKGIRISIAAIAVPSPSHSARLSSAHVTLGDQSARHDRALMGQRAGPRFAADLSRCGPSS